MKKDGIRMCKMFTDSWTHQRSMSALVDIGKWEKWVKKFRDSIVTL
jgi:hypothetical protein